MERLAPYIADSAELTYERKVIADSVSEYVCNHTQYLTYADDWKHNELIGSFIDYYNLNELDHAVRTDMDTYQRYLEGSELMSQLLRKVNIDVIRNDSLRVEWGKMLTLLADVYAQGDSVVQTHESYVDYDKPIFVKSNEQYEHIGEMFIRQYSYLEESLNEDLMPDADSVSPSHWLPKIYTDYVGQDAEATDEQWNVLFKQAQKEQDFSTKATMLFALLCMSAPIDLQAKAIEEAERMMEQGVYSPMLDLLWRAYRVSYSNNYGCPSTWCYSANLRYNYYRRIVAVTMLQYIDAHPDDLFAQLKYITHATRDNIMRMGQYMFGNESATESILIYWQGDIL